VRRLADCHMIRAQRGMAPGRRSQS
jgi:hypothetical protein